MPAAFFAAAWIQGHIKKRPPQHSGGKWQTCQNVFCQKTLAKLPGLSYTNKASGEPLPKRSVKRKLTVTQSLLYYNNRTTTRRKSSVTVCDENPTLSTIHGVLKTKNDGEI